MDVILVKQINQVQGPSTSGRQPRAAVRSLASGGDYQILAMLFLVTASLFFWVSDVFPQGRRGTSPSDPASRVYPSAVSIARLHYTGGGDWYWGTSSLPNLLAFMSQNTPLPVDTIEKQVQVSDPELYERPFLFATGHGVMKFSDVDRDRLRNYLNAGGFLFINDSYGMESGVRQELRELFPGRELTELPFGHEIYHSYYDFPAGLPKIHEHDGKPPRGYAILIDNRVAVFLALESDIGDGWEDPHVHNDPPEKRLAALRMGVNLMAYALRN